MPEKAILMKQIKKTKFSLVALVVVNVVVVVCGFEP